MNLPCAEDVPQMETEDEKFWLAQPLEVRRAKAAELILNLHHLYKTLSETQQDDVMLELMREVRERE